MTANTLNVLSGSTLNIAGGATISNSGTATGLADDMEAAYAGVLEANATFVDQAIFGPSVDGKSWNGKWSVASLFSSLMLVTIEDATADTQVNIWDLTEVSSSAPSTTPLGTVTLSGDATPTSVAACMGYIIVGSEDGISIIDPHSGAWAERTVGWPRTLSSSTTPALTNNDVNAVAAGFSDQPALDPRTGGPMPCFTVGYGTGADIGGLIKDDGTVYQRVGTVGNPGTYIRNNGMFGWSDNDTGNFIREGGPISLVTADDPSTYVLLADNAAVFGFGDSVKLSAVGDLLTSAATLGFSGVRPYGFNGTLSQAATFAINRTYNTGYMVGDIRGAWLANSATADRSYKANTLTENGTVTEAAVESGAELMGYSGFSSSNNFSRADDADFDFGTADFMFAVWIKSTGVGGVSETFIQRNEGSVYTLLRFETSGALNFLINDGSGFDQNITTKTFDDGVWHHVVALKRGVTNTEVWVDGKLERDFTISNATVSLDMTAVLYIGTSDGTNLPCTTTNMSLLRVSTTAPSATQIRQMYDAEKPMFVASAECLLQSGSTDAVLDVDVDPLTNKVLVTQTDAITIFDGLAVDSKPAVNAGSSEKGKLWGDLRAEQNSANAYVTAPAVDQRQVNEMVRGLASDLPKGVDLSKAKAWVLFTDNGSAHAILASYNIESVTQIAGATGNFVFGVPFKTNDWAATFAAESGGVTGAVYNKTASGGTVQTYNHSGSNTAAVGCSIVFFGELENE
jgi:hypothetical protein